MVIGTTRSQRGFSMIEILIVMVVLAILAAIAIPMYLGQRDRAKNAAAVEGGRTILIAILTYNTEHPDDDPWPANTMVNKAGLVEVGAIPESDWPKDPFGPGDTDMEPETGGDTTPGHYLYQEAPSHAVNGRHQIVVYRKNADPFVIP